MESNANCTTLGDIVTEFLIASGYESKQNYARFLDIAMRGLKEIHYDVSGATVWDSVTLDEFNRFCVPKNLIKLIAFFIPSKDGLIPIAENSSGNRSVVSSNGSVSNNLNIGGGYMWANDNAYDSVAKYYKAGQFKGGVLSGTSGNPYTYVENKMLNSYEFSSNVPNSILVQFLADPTRINDKYSVHPLIADALLQYLWYADNRFKPSVPEGSKAEMQRKYLAAKQWAHIRLTSQGKDDLVNSRNKAYSRLPK